MTGFVALEFLLMLIFHTFFIDSFYQIIKMGDLKDAAKLISSELESGGNISSETDEKIKYLARENNMCVEIFDSEGNEIYYVEGMPFGIIREMDTAARKRLYDDTLEEGGTKFYFENSQQVEHINRMDHKNFSIPGIEIMNDGTNGLPFSPPEDERPSDKKYQPVQNIIFSQTVSINGKEAVIALSTALTPLGATVSILNVETNYICAILLVLSILLAILIYRKISKPLMLTNQKALLLASGDYSVRFGGKGDYREIDQLNDTLSFAASELGKTEELRRELMANISHDLRTPLTMIKGYAELMRDIPGENTPENLKTIIDETSRLSDLVTDILDISKLQSGVTTLNKSVFSITKNINDILSRYSTLKENDGYAITFEHDNEAFIEADSIKMSQVLYNLINNAINYTGNDKKVVIRQTIKDGFVKIEIIDTGDGIDEKDMPFIWDRYYKVDKNHKSPVKGTGLGLSIVKNILELHGFEYGVISNLGKGSIFYFEAKISPSREP